MRGRPKKEKSAGLRIPQFSNLLKRIGGSSGTPEEYNDKLNKAASEIGAAAAKLARLEACCFSKIGLKLLKRKTLSVHPTDDATQDFEKIQMAIDHASPGDRILLKPGVFRSGGVVWVSKDIAIEGSPGTVIEGTTLHNGRVSADPATNGGFILVDNPKVEIRNLDFRNLYFAVASRDEHELDTLVFEDNICEDVYHSVYLCGRSTLVARNNLISITSLNSSSSKCRFNFFDESHVFGFYCDGADALLQSNRLEASELCASSPFHSVGAFCSKGKAVVSNNFFKGWHAPIVVNGSDYPLVYDNDVLGLSDDPQHPPIGIAVRNCLYPSVCLNKVKSRNLGQALAGIAVSAATGGSIVKNFVDVADSDSSLMLYRSNDVVVGGNVLSSPIALFGEQSDYIKGNLLFSNSVDHRIGLKMNYASGNTALGGKKGRSDDEDNTLLGLGKSYEEASPARLEKDHSGRHNRIFDHVYRKNWPMRL